MNEIDIIKRLANSLTKEQKEDLIKIGDFCKAENSLGALYAVLFVNFNIKLTPEEENHMQKLIKEFKW